MLAYAFYDSDTRIRRYAEALIGQGAAVDAIALRRQGQTTEEFVAGVRVFRLQKREYTEKGPLSYLLRLLLFFVRSAWVITVNHIRDPYDVIHVHSVPDFEVFATLIPRVMGARVILDIHDIVPELYASKFKISHESIVFRFLVFVEKVSIRYSNHVIIANHLWHERLIQRAQCSRKCSTILNYPDRSVFYRRQRPVEGKNDFVMFYPGTLSWHQGVDLVIHAMARLRSEAPNLRLVIFGDGHQRDALLALAKQCDVDSQVTIRTERPTIEVAEMMSRTDLGLEPKRKRSFANEALSTKILEFMAMEVPVLASDTRVHEMYFKDSIEYFESENVDNLAAKILEMMQKPERRRILQDRGTELVKHYDWGEKKLEYLKLIAHLVDGSAKKSRFRPSMHRRHG